jgi:ABC-type nitrate/sulfonate/bicarbonate transport system permease component
VASPGLAARAANPGLAARAANSAAARALTRVWLFVVLFLIWWLWSAGSKSLYFPPLSSILKALWTQWVTGPARAELGSSLEHLLVGYVIASLIGIGLGALLWSLRYLREATSPYIYFLYVLPAPVLVPAAMTLFGIGFTMKVVLIAFAALWPTLLNTLDGMRGVDQVKLDTSRVLGVSPLGRVFRVVLPAAAPQIVAGLRNSLQVAIILMVVSEWEASTDGIGYYIVNAQQSFDYVGMWSGIIVLAIIGTVANVLFVAAENRVLHWHYGARAVEGTRP